MERPKQAHMIKDASSIRFPPEIKQYLLQVAFTEQRTLSNMVIKIVKDYKERNTNG